MVNAWIQLHCLDYRKKDYKKGKRTIDVTPKS